MVLACSGYAVYPPPPTHPSGRYATLFAHPLSPRRALSYWACVLTFVGGKNTSRSWQSEDACRTVRVGVYGALYLAPHSEVGGQGDTEGVMTDNHWRAGPPVHAWCTSPPLEASRLECERCQVLIPVPALTRYTRTLPLSALPPGFEPTTCESRVQILAPDSSLEPNHVTVNSSPESSRALERRFAA